MPSTYQLDITGLSPGNRIVNETHTLTEINNSRYRIIIPNFAPFYLDNLAVDYLAVDGTVTRLVENQHYVAALPYIGASRSLGKMVYGGISFNTSFPNGSIQLTYQTLGGEWVASTTYVLERLATMAYNPRVTVWDVVTDVQTTFPPINHDQNVDYVYGFQEMVTAVNSLAAMIQNRPPPNKVTVGLGNVLNYPMATDAEVTSLEQVDKYITLRQMLLLLSTYGILR
jgi:hypothetical protein